MKRKALWVVVLLVAVGGILVLSAKRRAIEVEVARVGPGSMERTVSEIGEVVPREERTVVAAASFTVAEVAVTAGDSVAKDDILVVADDSELKLRIDAAEARLKGARARLEEAKSIGLPASVEMAEAEVEAARVERDRALSELQRLRDIYHIGGADEEEWKAAKDRYDRAEAELKRARASLEKSLKEAAGTGLEQYYAELEALTSELEALKAEARKYVVRAPADSRVVEVCVEEGAFVAAGQPLVVLEWGGFKVECEVLAEDMRSIRAGLPVEISGDAIGGVEVGGKVSRIHPRAREVVSELGTRQRRVLVEIDVDDENVLRSGYPVEVKFVLNRVNALAVPEKAVFEIDGEPHVFVVSGDRVRLRAVGLGFEGDEFYEVTSGLVEGDAVVVSPPKELGDNARVKVKRSR